MCIPLPWTLLNCDYFFFTHLHFLVLLFLHPQCACVCAVRRHAGSGVFWLPAKLMSKCHPHATVIQISYFLPFLVQTSHPSRLSPSFSPSRQAPPFLFLFAVGKRLMKFIQSKMGDAMPSSLPSSVCFFLFSLLPSLAALFPPLVLYTLLHSPCCFCPWRFSDSPISFYLIFLWSIFILFIHHSSLQPLSVSCSPRHDLTYNLWRSEKKCTEMQ